MIIQNKLFDNNTKSFTTIQDQRYNINKKNNATNINKEIIQTQNELLLKNSSLSSLTEKQVSESQLKNSNIDKNYTFLVGFILIFIIITYLLILSHKESSFAGSFVTNIMGATPFSGLINSSPNAPDNTHISSSPSTMTSSNPSASASS